jgi:hypothetical protein
MYVNWWDNPTNPDSWHKHQVGCAAAVLEAGCQDNIGWCTFHQS